MKDGLGRVQSVLVLGGDSDIGAAIAEELVRRGTREVVLAGRHLDRLELRANTVRSLGATRVETVSFDADDVESHDGFFDAVFTAAGRIDVVVVAFGVLGDQAAGERDAATAVRVLRTNFLGAASAMIHAGEKLRAQGQGTVVLLSSVAAQRPRRSNFIYGSSKAGIDALAEGLAFTLKEQGVQVLTVRPGTVKTKMTAGLKKAPFLTTPEKVAVSTADAIAKGNELVWSPRIWRYVMWALKFIPRPIFRKLKF